MSPRVKYFLLVFLAITLAGSLALTGAAVYIGKHEIVAALGTMVGAFVTALVTVAALPERPPDKQER